MSNRPKSPIPNYNNSLKKKTYLNHSPVHKKIQNCLQTDTNLANFVKIVFSDSYKIKKNLLLHRNRIFCPSIATDSRVFFSVFWGGFSPRLVLVPVNVNCSKTAVAPGHSWDEATGLRGVLSAGSVFVGR